MGLVAESLYELYEFERTGSVHKTLNIGMIEQIKNFIHNDTHYEIDDGSTNPYQRGHWRKKTPLWVCARYNKPDFVKYLLKTGASPLAQECAALRWACGFGYRDIAAMLLDAGADPDADGPGSGYDRETGKSMPETYRWAKRNGNYEIIDLLNRSKAGEIFFPEEAPTKAAQTVSQAINKPQEEPVEEPEEKGGWI